MWFLFFLRDFVSVPALLVAIFALIGALIQRKSFSQTVLSIFKVIIGFLILGGGAGVLVGSLNKFQPVFTSTYGLSGVIPNNDALAGAMAGALPSIVSLASVIMIAGMLINISLAVISRFKYVYLSGHVLYYTSIMLAIIMYVVGMDFERSAADYALAVFSGALVLGVYMIVSPAVQQRYMNQIIGTNELGLGHTGGFGYALSGFIGEAIAFGSKGTLKVIKAKVSPGSGFWKNFWARIFPRRIVRGEDVAKERYKILSTESIKFPKGLAFFRNTIVSTSLTVFIFYAFAFLPGGILYEISPSRMSSEAITVLTEKNWLVTMIVAAFTFTAGVEIILMGVRLFVGELVPMFKGISDKLVKNSKAAVDCPVVFPYAPNAVLIGFIASFIAGLVGMGVTIGMERGGAIAAVILPGLVPHFFLGATSGVFGNVKGGIWGAIVGPFVGGLIITFVPVVFLAGGWVPLTSSELTDLALKGGQKTEAISSLNWGDTDYIIGAIPGLFGLISKYAVIGVAAALYVIFVIDGLIARGFRQGPYKPDPALPYKQTLAEKAFARVGLKPRSVPQTAK